MLVPAPPIINDQGLALVSCLNPDPMQENHPFCENCQNPTSADILASSFTELGLPLCRSCSANLKMKMEQSTHQTISLYESLKRRGIPAELENYDGYKPVDIAVAAAKVNIEVDNAYQSQDHIQALADLKKSYHSFKKGFLTLRIPNTLVAGNLEATADYIADFLSVQSERTRKAS